MTHWPQPGDVGIFVDEVAADLDWRIGDACVFVRLYRQDNPVAGRWTNMRTGKTDTWLLTRFRRPAEDQP